MPRPDNSIGSLRIHDRRTLAGAGGRKPGGRGAARLAIFEPRQARATKCRENCKNRLLAIVFETAPKPFGIWRIRAKVVAGYRTETRIQLEADVRCVQAPMIEEIECVRFELHVELFSQFPGLDILDSPS
jgi:hypothetical protein